MSFAEQPQPPVPKVRDHTLERVQTIEVSFDKFKTMIMSSENILFRKLAMTAPFSQT